MLNPRADWTSASIASNTSSFQLDKSSNLFFKLFNKEVSLTNLSSWNEEALDAMLVEVQSTLGLSTPQINQPIRIALTGSTKSPSLGLTLSLFTKEEALGRIDALINYLDQ